MTGAPYFFNQIPMQFWRTEDKSRIRAIFNGSAKEWKKKSLSGTRSFLKTQLLKHQSYRCAYCRSPIVDELGRVEFDHVISKELAPQFCYTVLNLVLSCKRCNANKGSRNITNVCDEKLLQRKRYIRDPNKYLWVHPYFDAYKSHIVISDDLIFSAKNGCKKGLAVISACKLDKMSSVLSRRRRAAVISAPKGMDAFLSLIGQNPGVSPSTLADMLIEEKAVSLAHNQVVELIERVRSQSAASMLLALRAL